MKTAALTLFKIAISVALLSFALRGVDLTSVGGRIRELNPVWAGAATLAIVCQVIIAGLRWREIVLAVGGVLSVASALRLTFVGFFFSQTLPSTLGGDGVRLLLLQRTGVSWAQAAYSALVDRAVGFIVLAAIVLISLPWSYTTIVSPHGRTALLAVSLVAVIGSLSFLVFGQLRWSWIGRYFAIRHVHACAKETMKVLFRPAIGPRIQAASFVNHALTILVAWSIAKAIAVPLTLLYAALLIPLVVLVMTIPISIAGWGVREQSMQLAFLYAGLNAADGVAVSLLFGAAYLLVGIFGGVVWLLARRLGNAKAGTADPDHRGTSSVPGLTNPEAVP